MPALASWLTKAHPGFWHRKRGVAGVPLGALFNSASWRSSECYNLGRVAVREDTRHQTRKTSKSSNLLLSMWRIPVSHGRVEGIPLEEDLGYERTVAKLEERWGVALRTYDGRCPAEEWTGIYQGNNLLPGVVFQASTSFRPRISRDSGRATTSHPS
ncbi:unnamed protein product [Sphagnum tenellum]